MTRVLVTDGEQRAALAAVRSLGAAGREVYVAAKRPGTLAAASRFAAGSAVLPDALHEPAPFVEAVRSQVQRWGIGVLLPITEPSLLALLPHAAELGVVMPFPPLCRFREASDKALVMERARAEGIAIPEQHVLGCGAELDGLLACKPRFPLVLKPARSVGEAEGVRAKHGVQHVDDVAQLRAAVAEYPASAFPLLVQQRIVGPGIGVFVLLWDDEVRAIFAHRRLREKPPSGGVSVYRESVVAPAALQEATVRLLRRFRWQGVAMVEYKLDAATGTPYLMEINGRFWGSLQLAVDAGVDFPELLVRCALGEPLPSPAAYAAGVRSRWWWGDVDHLITRLRRSPAELHLPPGEPARWQVVRDFLLPRRQDRNEVLRWSDPLPFVRESIDWLRKRD